ncbi:MAG: SURF1 family protein [Wenzhouxiangellaceae bacterium]
MRKLIPHLAALTVIVACVGLARWQIDRAEQKRTLLARQSREPVAVESLHDFSALPVPAHASGRWLAGFQVLLDNQVHQGRVGVHVLTPLELDDGRVLVVNRGWSEWSSRDRPPPDPRPVTGRSVAVDGLLTEPPRPGLRMGPAQAADQSEWPRVLNWYDPAPLSEALGREILPAVLRLDPAHPDHLTHDPWPGMRFGPERHMGYALTWSLIALVVGGLWIVLGYRQFRSRPDR